MRWSRSTINFVLDSFALLVLVALFWTRLVTFLIVPASDGSARVDLWGLDHAHWDGANFWLTMLFALVILIHLVMHWTWITQFVHRRFQRYAGGRNVLTSGTQTIYGVAFMICILCTAGGLLMVASIMARPV